MTEAEPICLNGIDGTTGQYLVSPLTEAQVEAAARGKPYNAEDKGWLARLRSALARPFRALPFDIDPTDPARAGWGVVFAADTPAGVREALEPLIAHRRATVPTGRCKVLDYDPGEGMKDWLRRHGVYVGSVAPTRVPYYLLLVGGPEAVPFEFQYLLDIEYAVGRLAFDTADEYRRYADGVVAYEVGGSAPNAREVVYWGTRHPADRATQMSADSLIRPLNDGTPADDDTPAEGPIAATSGFRSRCFLGRDATRTSLVEALHGPGPALLVTASHGMGWPLGDPRQRTDGGALLAQDWTGFGAVARDHYLAGADVDDSARVHGLVAFLFACYGLGTPAVDGFLADRTQGAVPIAERPFVGALPQRLLSHPNGGALAVVGHVERAWGYSIRPPGLSAQIVPFRNFVGRVLAGEPVGYATKDLSEKYAGLSAALLDLLDDTRPGPRPPADLIARTWMERNDAQNYALLGDPATRLRVDLLT